MLSITRSRLRRAAGLLALTGIAALGATFLGAAQNATAETAFQPGTKVTYTHNGVTKTGVVFLAVNDTNVLVSDDGSESSFFRKQVSQLTPATVTPEPAPTTTTPTETTPTQPAPSPTAKPAAFPSRLKAVGRSFVDENGYKLDVMRGFNVHVASRPTEAGFVWPQSHFTDMSAIGAKINRAVLHWDVFEPAAGKANATAVAALDTHIARAEAAGMYTLLELHLNVKRRPTWLGTGTASTKDYAAHGKFITEYLANRYGNTASTKYTKAVIGFHLNEPNPIAWTDSIIPDLENAQRSMITWMRSKAKPWIAGVTTGYAQQNPYLSGTRKSANPRAYDSVGGNVFVDEHFYLVHSTGGATDDGRQANGMIWPEQQGGRGRFYGWGTDYRYPNTATSAAQLTAHIAPFQKYATAVNAPLGVTEWGIENKPNAQSTGAAYLEDVNTTFRSADVAMEVWWEYGTTSGLAARPGGTWQKHVLNWMKLPKGYPNAG